MVVLFSLMELTMHLKHTTCTCCGGRGFIRLARAMPEPCPYCFTLGFISELLKEKQT